MAERDRTRSREPSGTFSRLYRDGERWKSSDSFSRSTSLGYWLGESYQGSGIITRCCRALVDHAFTDLELHRVEIRAAVENTRSRAIPERLGFRHEGTIREAEWLYDHYVDHAVYGMLRPDWPRS